MNRPSESEGTMEQMRNRPKQETPSKLSPVRSFFEEPDRYLKARGFDVTIRTETVTELTHNQSFERILDIGCGDGSISLPLLGKSTRITLLDLSSTMTSRARAKIPAELFHQVELINEDFMAAELEPRSYDLIICLGVLAHVDSPSAIVSKMATLLKPNGRIIIEFFDSSHIVGRLVRLYQGVCAIRKPRQYSLNCLSFTGMARLFGTEGLRIVSVFRYSISPLPGLGHFLNYAAMYEMIRFIYGTSRSNRNAWLGDECICVLTNA